MTSANMRQQKKAVSTMAGFGKRARWNSGGRLGAVLLLSLAAACASPEEKVEKYTQSGEAFLEEGDIGKANIQFQNALKINEEHVPALAGMAQIAEDKQDFKNMFGLLQRIVRLDPQNLDAHVKLGKLYLIASDETAALDYAEQALAISPESVEANALKSAVQLKLGDTAGAIELARRVIAVDPANSEAATVLATERVLAGDYEAALAELERSLDAKPDAAVLQLLRISILSRLGREEETRAAYEGLIELFPDQPSYRRVFVTDLINREEYDEAAKQLEKIAELEPDNIDAKLDIIRIVMRVDGAEAAKSRMAGFVAAEPENVDLNFAYSDFLRQAGDEQGAMELLQRFTQSDDIDSAQKAKNKLATIYLRNGEIDEVRTIIADILAADERNTDALIKRAGLLIADAEYDGAILDLRTALDNNPDSSEAMTLMALAFERQDNPSFARAEYTKALEASDNGAKVANAFAKFLLRQEDQGRAEEVLVDSLAVTPGDLENLKLLAGIRLAQQDWRGAEEIGDIIERLEDQDALAENIKTAAYAGLGEYELLIDTLTSRNEDTPLESRPLASLVTAYIRTDRIDEAEELLNGILSSDDNNYIAYILLAQVHSARRDAAKAEEVLIAATEKNPNRAEAYEFLYRYYSRNDMQDKARALIDDGLTKSPENNALLAYKADALLVEGRLEEAFEIYSVLIDVAPDNKIIANNFVSLSSDLRQDSDSVARALEIAAVFEDESNPFYLDTLGWAYYRAGDFAKAIDYLSRASQAAAQNPEISYHLGASYYAAGDMENAKTALEQALSAGGEGFRYADEIEDLLGRL